MAFKLIGSVLIVLATTLIGFSYATALEKRRRSLVDFQTALTMLESEITFAASPLDVAFDRISKNIASPVGAFFSELVSKTVSQELPLQKIWTDTLDSHVKQLNLTQPDMQILLAFAAQMGKTDRENQIKNICHTLAQLKTQTELAGQVCNKNKRMYQSFGVLSGILIAILLF